MSGIGSPPPSTPPPRRPGVLSRLWGAVRPTPTPEQLKDRLITLTKRFPNLLIHARSLEENGGNRPPKALDEIITAAEGSTLMDHAHQTVLKTFMDRKEVGLTFISVYEDSGLGIPRGAVLLISSGMRGALQGGLTVDIIKQGQCEKGHVRLEEGNVRLTRHTPTGPRAVLASVAEAPALVPPDGKWPSYPSRPASEPPPMSERATDWRFPEMQANRCRVLWKGYPATFAQIQIEAERVVADHPGSVIDILKGLASCNIPKIDINNKGLLGDVLLRVLICSAAAEKGLFGEERRVLVILQELRNQLDAKLLPSARAR